MLLGYFYIWLMDKEVLLEKKEKGKLNSSSAIVNIIGLLYIYV